MVAFDYMVNSSLSFFFCILEALTLSKLANGLHEPASTAFVILHLVLPL